MKGKPGCGFHSSALVWSYWWSQINWVFLIASASSLWANMEITDTAFANDVYCFLWPLAPGMMSTKNSFYVGSCKLLSKGKAPLLSWLRVAAKKMSGAQKKQAFNNSSSEQAKEVLTTYLSCRCRIAFLQDTHTVFILVEIHARLFSSPSLPYNPFTMYHQWH